MLSLSPTVVGCLLKKRLTKRREGHRHPRVSTSYAPDIGLTLIYFSQEALVDDKLTFFAVCFRALSGV